MKQEMIKLLRAGFLFLFQCAGIAVGVALFLRTPLLVTQKAYLFRLLALDILCCMILLVFCIGWHWRRPLFFGFSFSEHVMLLGMATLFVALFLSLAPMPIERSYTIYSLADMADHGSRAYSAEEIKRQFIDGYIEGAQESQKRIDEQVYIGNLREVAGGYQITEKGERYVKLFRFIERVFPVPDENSIYPNGKEGIAP